MSTSRHYGIDLFRIVSMLMVVTLHVLGQGGVLEAAFGQGGKYEIAWVLETACYSAVNCFALISGYVGLRAKHRYANIAALWLQVLLVTLALSVVQYIRFPSTFTLEAAAPSLFPVFHRTYWYFTDYTILFFFMPLLNSAVHSLDKKMLRNALIFIAVLFCTSCWFPGPAFNKDPFTLKNGYSVMWLMLVYLIGAYLAKYEVLATVKKRWFVAIHGACVALAFGSKIALLHASAEVTAYIHSNTFIRYHSPLTLIASMALLLLFSRITVSSKMLIALIKFASPLCFGVYIIHLHPVIWEWLKGRFAVFASFSWPVMIGAVLATVVAIFVACLSLDAIRHYLFKWLKLHQRLASLEARLFHQETKE